MIAACLALIGVGFAVSCPLTWAMRGVGRRLGQLDRPGERKVHAEAVPATGGVAIFAALAGPLAAALAGAWLLPEGVWAAVLPGVVEHLEGVRRMTGLAAGVIGALAVLHVTGLIDDRLGLGPWIKLVVQVAAAGVVVIGFDVRLLEAAGPVGSAALTILWFVAITNAFNFLDNMDGLSGGVAAICGAIFLAAALLSGQWFVAAVLALLVGGLIGFLAFNFPPASIFMGDGGSLVVGFALAFCAVRVTYYDPAGALVGPGPEALPGAATNWWAVFTPVVVLAIPLYDLASVTLIRLAQGRSPFVGDTQHFSHRLVRRGLSRPAAVVVIWACTVATGLGGILLGRVEGWQAALVVAQCAAVLLVLGLLERPGGLGQDE